MNFVFVVPGLDFGVPGLDFLVPDFAFLVAGLDFLVRWLEIVRGRLRGRRVSSARSKLSRHSRPRQLLDQAGDFAPRFEMRHVADAREAVKRDEAAQTLRVMGRRYAILDSEHDFGRRLRRCEKAADVERLPAARENRRSEPALLRDQRPLLPLAQRDRKSVV